MRFNARNSINFAAQLLRVKKGKVDEFLSSSIKLLYIWLLSGIAMTRTQFLIFLELLAYFKRQETLFASQFSKKFNDNWFLMRFSCLTKNCYENPSGLDFFSFISSGSRKPENVVILCTRLFFLRIHFEIVCGVSFSVIIFKSVLVSNQTDIWLSKIRRVLLINFFFSHPKINLGFIKFKEPKTHCSKPPFFLQIFNFRINLFNS